ncbi:MAG: hypothetical protein WDO19_23210 [Bacteroidota bacterium]
MFRAIGKVKQFLNYYFQFNTTEYVLLIVVSLAFITVFIGWIFLYISL